MGIGTSVQGRGGYFYPSDVNLLAGGAARAVAEKCLDNTWGQIAVFRNEAAAIGPS
jgi:hypothetical protein